MKLVYTVTIDTGDEHLGESGIDRLVETAMSDLDLTYWELHDSGLPYTIAVEREGVSVTEFEFTPDETEGV